MAPDLFTYLGRFIFVGIFTFDALPDAHAGIGGQGTAAQLLAVGRCFPPGTPVSSTRKLISSSSFHRLDMTLAVAEALTPNKPIKSPRQRSPCGPAKRTPHLEFFFWISVRHLVKCQPEI